MEPLSRNHVLTPLLGDEVLVNEICALGPIRPRGKQRLANFHNVETKDFGIVLETIASLRQLSANKTAAVDLTKPILEIFYCLFYLVFFVKIFAS